MEMNAPNEQAVASLLNAADKQATALACQIRSSFAAPCVSEKAAEMSRNRANEK